ncbi:MAG: YbgC/FadM family acyl-CoA thioesterase [Deltaproteobacteria bacterium]|nr:YbgC/FadM family acyl-CoA thioesterase [Deltaproteobacteria bacterium]
MSELEIKIYYEDTDCGGVVYHANYLRYCERGRTEYFADRGVSIRDYIKEGISFVVSRAEVLYFAPARYGDILVVQSEIEKMKKVTLVFDQTIRRKGESTLLARAKIRLGCINGEGRPSAIPKSVAEVCGFG